MPHLVRTSSTGDVQPNSKKTFQVDGRSVLLANVGGKFYAIGAICNHARWDLSLGTLQGEEIVCAGHGSIWNLKTGEGKFVKPLPPEPVYKVEVKARALLAVFNGAGVGFTLWFSRRFEPTITCAIRFSCPT